MKKISLGAVCIACDSDRLKPLFLIRQEGVHPGEKGHEITYSHTVLAVCESCGSGQLEKLEHDCFDFEDVFDHYEWYVIKDSEMKLLQERLKSCTKPLDAGCGCEVHEALRKSSEALPTTPWETSMETGSHINRISVDLSKGGIRFKPKSH